MNKTGIVLALAALVGGVVFLATRNTEVIAFSGMTLKKGHNRVKYRGASQMCEVVFKSILTYLLIAYFWNVPYNVWQQLVSGDLVEPNWTLDISVSQDCIWTF